MPPTSCCQIPSAKLNASTWHCSARGSKRNKSTSSAPTPPAPPVATPKNVRPSAPSSGIAKQFTLTTRKATLVTPWGPPARSSWRETCPPSTTSSVTPRSTSITSTPTVICLDSCSTPPGNSNKLTTYSTTRLACWGSIPLSSSAGPHRGTDCAIQASANPQFTDPLYGVCKS